MAIRKFTKDDPDIQISEHFNTSELRCKCCRELIIDEALIDGLEQLREELGAPIFLTCAYRCQKHNKEIGGEERSRHLTGQAADLDCARMGVGVRRVAQLALKLFFADNLAGHISARPMFSGVGCYDGYQGKHGFVHVQVGGHGQRRWGNWL